MSGERAQQREAVHFMASRSRPVEEGTRDKITREKINKDLLRNT